MPITMEMVKLLQKERNCSLSEAKNILDLTLLLNNTLKAKTIEDLKLILMKLIDLNLQKYKGD